jgi:hypothetical protein
MFVNAKVMTMDPARPSANTVVVSGDRILSVSHSRTPTLAGEANGTVIDCRGRMLLPGFTDAHCHLQAYADSLISLNLAPVEGIRSIGDIQDKIARRCSISPSGSWIRAKSYNEFYLAEGRHPNRHDLDAVAPRHPVKLTHRSGHAHVLNSLALQLTGITEEAGDPPGGLIDREPGSGAPSGILFGMGEYLAGRIPPPAESEIETGAVRAGQRLLSYGVTSLQDASSANALRHWERQANWKDKRIFQPRITMMVGLEGFAAMREKQSRAGMHNADPKLGAVKIVLNRVEGSLQPSLIDLCQAVLAIHSAGGQVAIHAVEEPEIEAACAAIAHAMNRHPRHDPRHRIEHCSVCPPKLQQKIADLGITVVTQPSFIYFSGDRYVKTVPECQLEHLYPIGSLHRRGIPIGFSSDSPVTEPNPMFGICASVTRMTETGSRLPHEEGISTVEALKMQTLGGASAAFEDNVKGSITPGKWADLIILNEDPLEMESTRIKDIRVVMTVLGGRIVWSDGSLATACSS